MFSTTTSTSMSSFEEDYDDCKPIVSLRDLKSYDVFTCVTDEKLQLLSESLNQILSDIPNSLVNKSGRFNFMANVNKFGGFDRELVAIKRYLMGKLDLMELTTSFIYFQLSSRGQKFRSYQLLQNVKVNAEAKSVLQKALRGKCEKKEFDRVISSLSIDKKAHETLFFTLTKEKTEAIYQSFQYSPFILGEFTEQEKGIKRSVQVILTPVLIYRLRMAALKIDEIGELVFGVGRQANQTTIPSSFFSEDDVSNDTQIVSSQTSSSGEFSVQPIEDLLEKISNLDIPSIKEAFQSMSIVFNTDESSQMSLSVQFFRFLFQMYPNFSPENEQKFKSGALELIRVHNQALNPESRLKMNIGEYILYRTKELTASKGDIS